MASAGNGTTRITGFLAIAFVVMMAAVPGIYVVTMSDAGTIEESASAQDVIAAEGPEIEYRLYDMFEQPWGEWWPWRLSIYRTDIILSNVPHEYTMVYNPDQRNRQGIIYAPYRWNTTAVNLDSVDVHSPEFMPIFGTPGVAGAEADLGVYFEYLSHDWWDNYWVPTWSSNWNWSSAMESIMTSQESDGYYLGVLYNVTLNREAAEEWLGMPQTEDPVTWWNANRTTYMQEWQRWIVNEGNSRLDIWPGYEWPYVDIGTMTDLVEEPSGDVRLEIAHFSWGYEVLMTRWLNETAICIHEPYMEDFTLNAHFTELTTDLTFDAVAQYNLHAVKANLSADGAAWVWEPQRIDYVYYEGATRNSEFNPWDPLSYVSWNSGDMYLGDDVNQVPYDFTPQWFNLTANQTLIIQMPDRDDVVGYKGVALPYGSISALKAGNTSAYDSITVHGSIDLGFYVTNPSGGGANLSAMYDPVNRTLVIQGPEDFDNARHPGGELYHSTPWIEFNVTPPSADMPPVADAGPDQTVPEDSLVQFDGSNSTDDIGITNYTWTIVELSDTMWEMAPTYVFDTPGVYNVELVVMDSIGQTSDPDTVVITVADIMPPVADAGPDQNVTVGDIVVFDGSGSADNVDIVNYTWNFTYSGGPVELYGVSPSFEFNLTGDYVVRLTVLDAEGLDDNDSVTIYVQPLPDSPPVADAGADQIVPMGTLVELNGSGSTDDNGIVSWTWTFDDNGPQILSGQNVSYPFSNAGMFIITLNVTDTIGQWDTDDVVVTVLDTEPPVADAGPDQSVGTGDLVAFDGSGSSDNVGVVNWTWSFVEEGVPMTLWGETPTYTFLVPGVYNVTLVVLDDAGLIGTDEMTATVVDDDTPVADAGLDMVVLGGEFVVFNGSGSYDNVGIVNYTWIFVYDGSDITLWGMYPEFTFWIEGVYNITLTVTDGEGNSATDEVQVTVSGFIPEFPSMLLPVSGMLAILAAMGLYRRRRDR